MSERRRDGRNRTWDNTASLGRTAKAAPAPAQAALQSFHKLPASQITRSGELRCDGALVEGAMDQREVCVGRHDDLRERLPFASADRQAHAGLEPCSCSCSK